MKNIKKVLAALLAGTMLVSLAACSSKSAEKAETEPAKEDAGEESGEDGVKIGYISPGPDTWYLRAEEGAKWACEKAGAEFLSVNSNRDSEQEQEKQMAGK